MERPDSSANTKDYRPQPLEARLENDQVIFDFDLPELYKDSGSAIKNVEPASKAGSGNGLDTGTFTQIANSVDSWLPGAGTLLKGMGLGGDKQKTEAAVEKDGDGVRRGVFSADPEKGRSSDSKLESEAKPEPKKQRSLDAEVLKRLASELKAEDPVARLDQALNRLDGIDALSVRKMQGGAHHVDVDFKAGTTSDAPNIKVRGFRPQATHTAEKVSFDLKETQSGLKLSNMQGFTSTVRGPLGALRTSTSNSMTIGQDANGPYIDSSSSMRVLGKVRSSAVRLRDHHFEPGSPMRQIMHQPEAMEKVASMMRLFRNTDDISSFNLENNRDGSFNVGVGAASDEHIEIGERLDDLGLTVESIDLDSRVSARIERGGKNDGGKSVSLEDIQGLTVNLDTALGAVKLNPLRVAMVNDDQGRPVLELEVKNPNLERASIGLSKPVGDAGFENASIKLKVPMAKLIYDQIESGQRR